MGFSQTLVDVANRLISNTEYSASLTYTSVTPGGYASGTMTAETTSDSTVRGVIDKFDDNLINDISVKRGDLKVLIDSTQLSSVTPSTDDRLTIDSIVYKVISFLPIYAGPSIAYYQFQIRRGQ